MFECIELNLAGLANGSLDTPAVTITIWIVYLSILAITKNPKYFIAVLPLVIIGFFRLDLESNFIWIIFLH